jgi:hypothetical protein
MIPLLISAAFAGYGDANDGYPTASERLLHLWTNVARVAPGDFTAAYARGGCALNEFQPSERTPKAPLAIQHALNVVARTAIDRRTGARGLRSIMEGILLDTMFDLPGLEGVEQVVIGPEVVEGKARPLYIYAERNEKTGGGAA